METGPDACGTRGQRLTGASERDSAQPLGRSDKEVLVRHPASVLVAFVLAVAVMTTQARAADTTLDAFDSGFVTEAGGSSKYDGLLLAPATFNYSAGFEVHYADGGTGGPGGTVPMMRKNYFVFDLSSVSDPIVGATLLLYNPAGGYESTEPSETFVLAGSASPSILADLATMAALTMPLDPSAVALAMSIYGAVNDTLGGIPDFGTVILSAADDDTTVSIPLSGEGLAYLNAGVGGMIVLGGEVTSAVPPLPIPQAVFGFTEPTFTSPKAMMMITTEDSPPPSIPAASTLAMALGLLLVGAGWLRRRGSLVAVRSRS